MPTGDAPLLVGRPKVGKLVALIVVLIVIGVAIWYSTHPNALPRNNEAIEAATPAGVPTYVGVFAPNEDFDRTLRLSGVKVNARSATEVSITPLLCKEGHFGVTSAPDQFCAELVNPEGEAFDEDDTIVLEVTGDDAATVDIERVSLAFREGIRTGTREAGVAAVVQVLPR